MCKPNIYIAERLPSQVEQYLAKYCNYEKWDFQESIPREILFEKLADKDGVILTGVKIDNELLDHAPKLKVVSNISVGYNNFDLDAMTRRDIIGTNTPNVLNDTVADLIIGLMLSTSRRMVELDKYVKDNKWIPSDEENVFGLDVHHATLGIIGMGRIGEVVAKRAKFGFDMDVLYYNRHRNERAEKSLGLEYCDLDSLLRKSDFIVVMVPLTKDTYHLIDEKEFNKMKSTAIFINASRGQTVNERALIEALESNKIYAAGLDVYEIEPISLDNSLLKMPNVVVLPHIGSATKKTRLAMSMLAAENLIKALQGENPQNIVPELIK